MRHCVQCGKEMMGPPSERELRLRTFYAPADLCFCGTGCLIFYLNTAPEHEREIRGVIAGALTDKGTTVQFLDSEK
jgi:hypothetical protein